MRKILFSALLMVAMMVPANMLAQGSSNRDENGKINRGPYVTNGVFDNLFVGVGVGMNGYFGEATKSYKPSAGAQLDIQIGKWFIPDFGLAIGYSGLTASGRTTHVTPFTVGDPVDGYYKENLNFAYVYTNLMWNMINTIWGYKSDRVYNLIPYLTFGYEHSFKGKSYSRNFAEGAGLLNTIRVAKNLNVTVDARAMVVSGKFHTTSSPTCLPSLTVGAQYEFGKNTTTFSRYKDVSAADIKDATRAAVSAVASQSKSGSDSKSGNTQIANLDNYVRYMLAKDPLKTFTVTAYGDAAGDRKVSKARAEFVKNYLVDKFGINPERIIIKYVDTPSTVSDKAEINRSIVVE